MFSARIYDQDRWLSFANPEDVLVARNIDEVLPLLRRVESATDKGSYAVGFVSYEAASAFDASLQHHQAGDMPLAMFAIFDEAVPGDVPDSDMGVPALNLQPCISQQQFETSIGRVKAYLKAGDSYQVNFTHPLKGQVTPDVKAVFNRLYQAQPSPYAACIETRDFSICSVSPELFFSREGSSIRTEPMKGTRPRGRYPEEDEQLRSALAQSAKDRAENLMIVDMIRNDLGRIAAPGTVNVDQMFTIKRFPTVWQQVSSVTAESQAGLDQVFTALFPCASVTGAPKSRTMAIIRELETEPRGVYTGAIGLVKPGREACFSVAIRTLVINNKTGAARYGVGGGIVWDSDAADEWQESLTKAEVLGYARPTFQLLETMRLEPASGIYLQALHLERLRRSAEYFGFACDTVQLAEKLNALESDAPIRIRLLMNASGEVSLEKHPIVKNEGAVRLRLANRPIQRNNIFLFHKTTHREVYEGALADFDDCDDVILWNEQGELTETTISNLFLEIDGELLTPVQSSGLLAGTYRQKMLAEGKAKEAVLTKSDLEKASRIFVANSVRLLNEADLIR